MTLHVLARFLLQLSLPVRAEDYLDRLEELDTNQMLKQPFVADCSLLACPSWGSVLA